MADDITLPTPPDDLASLYSDDSPEQEEIVNNELTVKSPLNLDFQFTSEEVVTDDELSYLTPDKLEKSLIKAELVDTNMYLKNIHQSFKYARSTRSVINLVGAGLAVHKHRREMLKEVKQAKGATLEFDQFGNLKT